MAVINNLRTLFENEYPGKKKIFEELIKPIFVKAKDTTLTNQLELSEADKKQIKSFSIIAQVRGGFPITFADVELNDTVALKRSRVNIQNCVRKIMANDSNAIIFFHFADNSKEWRVSYCHRATTNKETTDAKRYTYLCGTEHSCRTIAERFATLQGLSTIKDEDMLNAFSVESLTKEFFTQIFKWYDSWACKIALFPSKECIASHSELTAENNNLHLIRLITRIMFVWFIKQKDLIPSWVFNKAELESLLSDPDLESEKKGNYYNAVLQNLFFGALNKKIEERSFAEKSFDGVPNEQYGIKSYFRDDNKSSFFTVSHKEMQEHFEGVPFLNGGLFECLDYDVPHGKDSHKVHYVDGFSRNAERRAFVPNALFWSEDEANLGLIPIFCRYNFTVEESTPNDVQVALDPELLGKIFENLLGTFNPETKESARKESGSFYTPREIVSYMVNTSLASYLHEKVPALSEEIIEKLTNDDKSDDEDIQLTESQIDELRKALVNIKIIDPACGSGAFPMGILNKLVEIHVLLNRLSASTHSDKNLYIKKGQFVNYTPNDELKINAEYLGEQKFRLSVSGNTENEVYTSQELAVHVKDIINKYNKKLHKNTIANLFSQGRIDDGKSFNSIKTKQEILQIVDADSKEIIWQYKTYNVENKFRKYRTEGSEQTASKETETEDGLLNYNSLYNLKTQIIQDSIFGVDIQPIAVQICKLRFFISLICEQPKTGSKENNYGYNPLPNLETKFVAANTLIGLQKDEKTLLDYTDEVITNYKNKLIEVRKNHFAAKNITEKMETRCLDETLRKEIIAYLQKNAGKVDEQKKQHLKEKEAEIIQKIEALGVELVSRGGKSENLFGVIEDNSFSYDRNEEKRNALKNELKALQKEIVIEENKVKGSADISKLEELIKWNPYDQNATSTFFDSDWMFGVKDGFDIVIGNPPYIPLQDNKGFLANIYEDKNYDVFDRSGDIYSLFYEQGINLLTQCGSLCYITSSQWLRAGYGKNLRKYLVANANPKLLIDFTGVKVFDATVDPCILLATKEMNAKQTTATKTKPYGKEILPYLNKFVLDNATNCAFTDDESWVVLTLEEQKLKEKLKKENKLLKNFNLRINYGVKTGFNEAFIISEEKRNEIINCCKTEDEKKRTDELITPVLRGRDIRKYGYIPNGLFQINTHNGVKEKNIQRIKVEYYPSVKKHLDSYYEKLAKRSDKGDTPYNLRNCAYLMDFYSPKIVYPETTVRRSEFFYDDEGFLLDKTCFFISGENLKFIEGLLTSKLMEWYLERECRLLGKTTIQYSKQWMENIPIPYTSKEQQQPIIDLVDKILAAKKADATSDTTTLERKIDELVYKLYGLTDEEIAIVEGK